MKTFKIDHFKVGGNELTFIGGPCMIESQHLCEEVAGSLKEICKGLGINFIFKSSFDKANRSSVSSSRGIGLERGLKILEEIKNTFQIPIVTDIHLPDQAAEVANIVDIVQIPAFLSRQGDLLEAAAKTGLPVKVKKAQFMSPWDAENIVHKLEAFGAAGILLVERGTMFGYNRLVVDMPGLEVMRSFGYPICFDTHSAMCPGGGGKESSGQREWIPALTRAAAAVGIDALYVEVHPDPDNALSDRSTQWPLSKIKSLLESVKAIYNLTKQLEPVGFEV